MYRPKTSCRLVTAEGVGFLGVRHSDCSSQRSIGSPAVPCTGGGGGGGWEFSPPAWPTGEKHILPAYRFRSSFIRGST